MTDPHQSNCHGLELLTELVSIPSPTGSVDQAARRLVQQMREHGIAAEVGDEGSVIGLVEPTLHEPEPGEIYLLGHLDTVEGFWPPEISGGRLTGRGTSDAKGPLIAFLVAALRARESGRLGRRIRILAVADEEGESQGARRIARTLNPPAFLVVGEPSGSTRLVLGYRGRLRCRLLLSCPARHSSRPEPTAAELGVGIWIAIRDEIDAINCGISGFDAVDVHLLRIDSESDGLEETVRLELGFRLPPSLGPSDLEARLRGLELGGKLEISGGEPAAVVPRAGKLATSFAEAIRAEGQKVVWQRRLATSDLNVVLPEWRCPAVVYGPGDSELDHTPGESIELTDFARGIRVLTRALLAL